jgi:hypothetical protein
MILSPDRFPKTTYFFKNRLFFDFNTYRLIAGSLVIRLENARLRLVGKCLRNYRDGIKSGRKRSPGDFIVERWMLR